MVMVPNVSTLCGDRFLVDSCVVFLYKGISWIFPYINQSGTTGFCAIRYFYTVVLMHTYRFIESVCLRISQFFAIIFWFSITF